LGECLILTPVNELNVDFNFLNIELTKILGVVEVISFDFVIKLFSVWEMVEVDH